MAQVRARIAGGAVMAVAASMALTGCATIAESDRLSSCEASEKYQVTRTGDGVGPVITDTAVASLSLGVSGASGEQIAPLSPIVTNPSGESAPIKVAALLDQGFAPLSEITRCARAGETLTAQIPLVDFPAVQQIVPANAQHETVEVTIVVDRVYHSSATGRVVPPQSGIPAVVTAPDGRPGVTMPESAAPTSRQAATTIAGFGPQVGPGHLVTMQVSVFAWDSGRQLVSTWEQRGPALQLPVGSDDGFFGVTEQLIGVKVGSQRVVIVPAAEVNAQAEVLGITLPDEDAAVIVVDVLGVD